MPTPTPAPAQSAQRGPAPLTALDFVRGYLNQSEHAPLQGHYVESHACRIPDRPSGQPKDSDYRCLRCDGEALLSAATLQDGPADV